MQIESHYKLSAKLVHVIYFDSFLYRAIMENPFKGSILKLKLNEFLNNVLRFLNIFRFDILAFNFFPALEIPRLVYQISMRFLYLFLNALYLSFTLYLLFLFQRKHVHVYNLDLLDEICLCLVLCSCFCTKLTQVLCK